MFPAVDGDRHLKGPICYGDSSFLSYDQVLSVPTQPSEPEVGDEPGVNVSVVSDVSVCSPVVQVEVDRASAGVSNDEEFDEENLYLSLYQDSPELVQQQVMGEKGRQQLLYVEESVLGQSPGDSDAASVTMSKTSEDMQKSLTSNTREAHHVPKLSGQGLILSDMLEPCASFINDTMATTALQSLDAACEQYKTTVENAKQRQRELQEENNRLKEENARMGEDVRGLRETIGEVMREKACMEEDMAKVMEDRERIDKEMRRRVAGLMRIQKEMEEEKNILTFGDSQEVKKLREEKCRLEEERDEAVAMRGLVEEECSKMGELVDELYRALDVSRERLGLAREENTDLERENAKLCGEKDTLVSRLDQLHLQYTSCLEELHMVGMERDHYQVDILSLQARCEEYEDLLEDEREEKERREGREETMLTVEVQCVLDVCVGKVVEQHVMGEEVLLQRRVEEREEQVERLGRRVGELEEMVEQRDLNNYELKVMVGEKDSRIQSLEQEYQEHLLKGSDAQELLSRPSTQHFTHRATLEFLCHERKFAEETVREAETRVRLVEAEKREIEMRAKRDVEKWRAEVKNREEERDKIIQVFSNKLIFYQEVCEMYDVCCPVTVMPALPASTASVASLTSHLLSTWLEPVIFAIGRKLQDDVSNMRSMSETYLRDLANKEGELKLLSSKYERLKEKAVKMQQRLQGMSKVASEGRTLAGGEVGQMVVQGFELTHAGLITTCGDKNRREQLLEREVVELRKTVRQKDVELHALDDRAVVKLHKLDTLRSSAESKLEEFNKVLTYYNHLQSLPGCADLFNKLRKALHQ